MPTLLEDLIIDRVDLCDEGANSEAFIELYKRKETSVMDVQEILKQMKPEHAKVIQDTIDASAASLKEAQESLAKACTERDEAKTGLESTKKELEDTKKALEDANDASGESSDDNKEHPDDCTCPECASKDRKSSGNASFDQTETFKSMPKEVQDYLNVIKQQKEAAEEELRKSKEAAAEAEAIAKASELKAIPVEKEKLVGILKTANKDVVELLETINGAIEGTVLGEVGKTAPNAGSTATANEAWAKIDKKADELVKTAKITKAKAVSQVITDNPDLYREYLEGGAN